MKLTDMLNVFKKNFECFMKLVVATNYFCKFGIWFLKETFRDFFLNWQLQRTKSVNLGIIFKTKFL